VKENNKNFPPHLFYCPRGFALTDPRSLSVPNPQKQPLIAQSKTKTKDYGPYRTEPTIILILPILCKNKTMSISHLRKLAKKSLIPRSLVCLTTASPFSTFANLPTSAYYDDLSNTARHKRDFSKLRYLLNKRVRDHCFNTTSTLKFITTSETSLSILADLI
jgi:large subunit ribosomal protein L45